MPAASAASRRPALARAITALSPGNPGWLVLIASLALTALGMYCIHISDVIVPGQTAAGNVRAGMGGGGVVIRQGVYAFAGILGALVIAIPNYRSFGHFTTILGALTVAVLAFLLIPIVPTWIVKPHNGARGWINFGFADLQPAEFAKIVYVLVVAWYLRYRTTHRRFWGLVPIGLVTMIPVGLITLQPDLGGALLFIPSLFAMLVAAGARLRHLTIIVVVAALAAPLCYQFLRPHQKQRLVGLWKQFQGDSSADKDINFQSMTAQTLIGAGGTTGVSPKHSRALLHFNALPERHNDMITAVIGNRFGLLGIIATLALMLTWAIGALLVAGSTKDPFGRLIAVGLGAFVGFQAMVNIAMNVGLAPIVGVTLPFVSYGGSSMLSAWLMTGLIINIAIRRPEPVFNQSFEFDGE
ncbi:MAG: FtsW/RodA/SpoVE family cell cycle protein [Planctomycetota bacterium]